MIYGKGGDVDLKLDLAIPKEGTGRFPAVVCVHGGGWKAGNRQSMEKTIETLAARGYVGLTVSYRLTPAARRKHPRHSIGFGPAAGGDPGEIRLVFRERK